jgi:hypothetical protein
MNSPFSKPFALAMGPQLCGTDWLEAYLQGRGDICLPQGVKETFFFDRHFTRGDDFYFSHFRESNNQLLIMELATTVFDVPEAAARVNDLVGPKIKLLCPLRHPVDRAYAAYQEFLRYGIVSGPVSEAADQAPQILHSSRYADHLARWIDIFGAAAIKIVYYEDLIRDPAHYVGEVCAALGIPYKAPADKSRFSGMLERLASGLGGREPAGSDDNRHWLQERLEPEMVRLEKLLGHGIRAWQGKS